MASSVDFPQPEGPAIERYSPFFNSKWTAERACVSTSSVTNTLLTLSIRMSGSELLSIVICSCVRVWPKLVQFNSIVGVISRHVRENHLVPYLKTVRDLDSVYRTFAES